MSRTIRTTCAALLLLCGAAAAQGHSMQEEMRKRMEEISKLMRESERLLLEMTRVDRLVDRQQAIERELAGLLPEQPPPEGAAANPDREKKIEELKKNQAEVARQLSSLFDDQRKRAELTVRQLEELLKNWPKRQQQGGGQGNKQRKSKEEREREKRLREKQQEQKQSDPNTPRNKKDMLKDKKPTGKRPQDESEAERRKRHVQAWIAKLPPAEVERINRGDLSRIPARYRRLVREYTALRAKREAEESDEEEGR